MGIFSKIFGDGKQTLPDILCNTEEGFADATFAIVGSSCSSDGCWHFNVRAVHSEAVVGFEVVLGAAWREGSIDLGSGEQLPTYTGIVDYCSVGGESDRLVSVFSQLYGVHASKSMSSKTRFTAISLGGNPANVETEKLKIKLFFEEGGEDDYAEVFTNISYSDGVLEVREKDPEYRASIVKAISNDA